MLPSVFPISAAPISSFSRWPTTVSRYEEVFADPDVAPVWWVKIVVARIPGGATETMYFSDVGWASTPEDTPADKHFDGRADRPIVFRQSIQGNARLGGRGALKNAEIELSGEDGGLVSLATNYAIDGRDVEVRFGRRDWLYSQGIVVFKGTATGWRTRRNSLLIQAEGLAHVLDLPIQDTFYTGMGGSEGNSNFAGKPKPLPFGGLIENYPVDMLNSDLTFQVADGPIQGISGVYDRSVALTFHQDYATYAELVAATIPAGRYGTCLAQGYGRLGDEASGQVTVDFYGLKIDGTFYDNPFDLIQYIAQEYGGLTASQIDAASFADAKASFPYPVQVVAASNETVSQVLDRIVESVEGWWADTPDGLLTVGLIENLTVRKTTIALDEADILSYQEEVPPDEVSPAVERTIVEFRRNYFVQTSDFDAAISATRKEFVVKEFRQYETNNAGEVVAVHPKSRDLTVRTDLTSSSGAQALATRIKGLYGLDHRYASATLGHKGLQLRIGSRVRLTSAQFGLSNVEFVVVDYGVAADQYEVSVFLYSLRDAEIDFLITSDGFPLVTSDGFRLYAP